MNPDSAVSLIVCDWCGEYTVWRPSLTKGRFTCSGCGVVLDLTTAKPLDVRVCKEMEGENE